MKEKEEKSFEKHPFPFLCIDNYLTKEECDALISEASGFSNNDRVHMHGGRSSLGSLSPSFLALKEKSNAWSGLVNRLQSGEAMHAFLRNIHDECPDAYFLAWLKSRRFVISELPSLSHFLPRWLFRKARSASERQIRFATKKQMLLSLVLATANDIFRFLHGLLGYARGERSVALLFDYSVAREGYGREVHRDSDARVVVFLLYLNDLEHSVTGGSLNIHEIKSDVPEVYKPRPDDNEVKRIKQFQPKAGRLLMFLNTANSYHSVDEMSRSENGRHFLYGAYTLTTGLGSLALLKSRGRLPTEYNLYRE